MRGSPAIPRKCRSLAERFWEKADRSAGDDACWPWTSTITKNGYGRITEGRTGSRLLMAHRVSYELNIGPIPEGQQRERAA